MPDPTTPPPLDDREKVARAIHEQVHRHEFRDRGCGLTTYDQRLADAVLAALDLPARDRDTARAALGSLQSFARECLNGEHGEIDAEVFSGWHHTWAAAMQHRVIHYPRPDTTQEDTP